MCVRVSVCACVRACVRAFVFVGAFVGECRGEWGKMATLSFQSIFSFGSVCFMIFVHY